MKFKSLMKIILLSFTSFSAYADEQLTTCESNNGEQFKIIFHSYRSGVDEALELEYQGRDVMADSLSVFNHMGYIFFKGTNGIEFHADEYSDEFYVTMPAFGGVPLETARGKCIKSGGKLVVGRGVLGDGIFGSCTDSGGIGYLGTIKSRAYVDALSKCSSSKGRLIGKCQISTECVDNEKTAVAKAFVFCTE